PLAEGGKRLFSPYLKNGVIVQVAAQSEYASMEAFREAILALPLQTNLQPEPHVRFRSLRGNLMEFTWGQTPKLNGKPLDYAAWPLFGGPFVESAVDSQKLVLKYGHMRRTLDFRTLTAVDEGGASGR
ncbi:MAG TPA: hypothetical protein VKV15_06460, partial [Bryobacteraceae bacterium]|nr:hypothetical protein [Bryobacteraceae bacterium]